MESSHTDLCNRIERLERQGRWTRFLCGTLALVAVILAGTAFRADSASTVQASRFVLRDVRGRVRAEIAMSSNGLPEIRLLDENGKASTTIVSSALMLFGQEHSSAMLLPGGLTLSSDKGLIALDSGKPEVEVTDSDFFQAALGSRDLVNKNTGTKETTSAATLTLFDKKGQLLWRTPGE